MLDFVFGFASFAVDSTLDSASNLMRDFALGFTLDSSLSPPPFAIFAESPKFAESFVILAIIVESFFLRFSKISL